MNSTLRAYLLPLHRWTGLSLGLVFALVALTGAGMVFRPQLEPLVNAELLSVAACAERAPLDILTRNALAANQGSTPLFIRIFSAPEGAARIPSTLIRFADKNSVYLNPCTGAVLGKEPLYSGIFGTLESLHRFRYLSFGSLVAGTLAMVCGIVLVGGGLAMWWSARLPMKRRADAGRARPPGAASALWLHRRVGAYAGVVVLASVLTGLPQAFDWCRGAMYALTGSAMPAPAPRSFASGSAGRLPMEAFWQRARLLVPEPREAQLRYPVAPTDSVAITLIARDAPHPNARSVLHLDAYTGRRLSYIPYAASSLGQRLSSWTLSLHTGLVGGMLGKLMLMAGALAVPLLAFTGLRSVLRRKVRITAPGRLSVRVARKRVEAENICTFELVACQGSVLPPFGAGAHIDVYLGNGMIRQYSLCNDPGETHRYLIGVLRHPQSRGGSRMLHDEVEEGDVLQIGEPRNHFPLVHPARRSLLMAGGIGVTPILCMAERLANIGAEFEMHYRGSSAGRMAFVDYIRRCGFADRVFMHFSDGGPEQLLDLPVLLFAPDPTTHLYVCGPSGFMDLVIETARQQGWADTNVHREYFAGAVRPSATDSGFDVKIASTGKMHRVAHDETVLDALARRGIDIPSSCRQGVCGTCLTRVLDGEPDHRDLFLNSEEQARNDQFLPCCSRARSAVLVLDL